MVVNPNIDYVIDGRTLRDLFKIASRFNDGMRIGPDERRDLAQAMQVKLEKASPYPLGQRS